MTKPKLEKITEVEFERGLIKIVRDLNSQIQQVSNMFKDIDYYKSKGYVINYYIDKKDNSFNYFAGKEQIGFKPNY